MPVEILDGEKVGLTFPGVVTGSIQKNYWDVHEEPIIPLSLTIRDFEWTK